MRRYLPYLDGIRGLCALYVCFHHSWGLQYQFVAHSGWFGLLTNWSIYGHLAVDLFIVLSGYCLGVSQQNIDIWKFIKRRSVRILPPYYAAFGLAIIVAWIQQGIAPIPGFLSCLFLSGEMYPSRNMLLLPQLWSVGVEFKIYLLFPLLLWALRRWGAIVALPLSGLLTILIIFSVRPFLGAPIPTIAPWYVILFTLGLCVSRYQLPQFKYRTIAITAGTLLIAITPTYSWVASGNDFYPNVSWQIDIAFGIWAAAMLALLEKRSTPFLSSPPLVLLGSFSYSLYLTHWLILNKINGLVDGEKWMVALLGVVASVGFAYGFYLLFERPFTTTHKLQAKEISTVT